MADIEREAFGEFWQRYADMGDGTHALVVATSQVASPRAALDMAHSAVNVTVASGLAVAANTERRYLLLVNDSDEPIYLALGQAAALNTGIRLNTYGCSLELGDGFGNLYTGAVYAIHGGTGNKVLLITEGS